MYICDMSDTQTFLIFLPGFGAAWSAAGVKIAPAEANPAFVMSSLLFIDFLLSINQYLGQFSLNIALVPLPYQTGRPLSPSIILYKIMNGQADLIPYLIPTAFTLS